MIQKKLLFLFFSVAFVLNITAQKHQDRYNTIDVLNYTFNIELSDATDVIKGTAEIKIKFKKAVTSFQLDLVKKETSTTGMYVELTSENGTTIQHTHANGKLTFRINKTTANEVRIYKIIYKGVPADGLIISKNKYGERTFFGDNWPDRGQNWLPIVDHPSDKATVEWVITAPSHYQTIGNGIKIEETNLTDTQTLSRWKMVDPIPTKVMVIGAARFAVENLGEISNVPISSWVYPQDRDYGFSDYALATPIMDYFVSHVGDYPFKKLANVQSKTRFGGMENAGNIFYSEGSVTGTGSAESLIAHEIAHQWFGNSASELNWHHIWLSEGFATYFTNLYFEHKYGRDVFISKEKEQRQTIINFANQSLVPTVNPKIENYMELLNRNSYEKGGWTLHMLRRALGDDVFWKSIRKYYKQYKYSNALSEDLQAVMESVSGKSLDTFFRQWLYQAGHPKLQVSWSTTANNMLLSINQIQPQANFDFPLDVKLNHTDGSTSNATVSVSRKSEQVNLSITKAVESIEIDPNTWLLFELISLQKIN